MDNLELYNKVRKVPKEAQKEIGAGRLKGMTDINPQWRIKTLTEQFGPCGIGWYIEPVREWLEQGSNGEVTANVMIQLHIKQDNEWSKGIVGIGGSKLIAKESGGLYTSDECYKMAYTDAISVACKLLGIGADVYWDKDRTKYDANNPEKPTLNKTTTKTTITNPPETKTTQQDANDGVKITCSMCNEPVTERVAKYSKDKFGKIYCYDCQHTINES